MRDSEHSERKARDCRADMRARKQLERDDDAAGSFPAVRVSTWSDESAELTAAAPLAPEALCDVNMEHFWSTSECHKATVDQHDELSVCDVLLSAGSQL